MTKNNQPLPLPPQNDGSLRKEAAYKTLAVEEFSRNLGSEIPPQSGDDAVAEAREWVEYDKL